MSGHSCRGSVDSTGRPSNSYSRAVRVVHLPPVEDLIEHDVVSGFTYSCICGPMLTLTRWGQEYVYLLTHHALIG
jgi:hypothetical protein